VKEIDNIGEYVVVIPDQPDIRRIASDFGKVKKFEVRLLFELLEKECETEHLGILSKRVKKIMESKTEKK
jgi:hypothetical protein